MENKLCSKCNISKPLSEFNKDKGKKDGHNQYCRSCNREYLKSYYKKNAKEMGKANYETKKKNKISNRLKMLEYLKTCFCTDCGNKDVRVLEFDHILEKKMSVNRLIQEGIKWDRVMAEVDKCEVVCSNCHKIRTYSRSGSYRNG